jgi:alkylated DNA repair dioxygenase AlkB
MAVQSSLALDSGAGGPAGFLYRGDFVSGAEQEALVADVRSLPFAEVKMRGQVARRRTVHLGWLYGYEGRAIEPGPPVPEFLLPLRARAAGLAGVDPEELGEVLVTEYTPGAGIGWHRDAPMFGTVVGVSLLGACRFRLRRARRDTLPARAAGDVTAPSAPGRPARRAAWETYDVSLEPRSVYVLRGSVRWAWQHSIPPTRTLRYSITFRTLRGR